MEFIILVLLQVKHYLIDFQFQTAKELKYKGTYGNFYGLAHSIKHALLTFFIFVYFDYTFAVGMFMIDFLAHYHIDYIKMKYGSKNIVESKFWRDFGLDQLAHQICYAGYMYLFVYNAIG